ncbi:hypothetical protein [Devosia sp. YR412]|nr:hypothetical protein [Devosia sp. YR412]
MNHISGADLYWEQDGIPGTHKQWLVDEDLLAFPADCALTVGL